MNSGLGVVVMMGLNEVLVLSSFRVVEWTSSDEVVVPVE